MSDDLFSHVVAAVAASGGSRSPLDTPVIAEKKVTGSNANSGQADSVSMTYDHPGGLLVVFFRHAAPASGHSVSFDGQSVPISVVQDGLGTGDWPTAGVAVLDAVAADDSIVVSWNGDVGNRGIMAFSITEATVRDFETARYGDATNVAVTVPSVAGDLVLSFIAWRNSGESISDRSGTQELNDDSPTRMESQSQVGDWSESNVSWTKSSHSTDGANLIALSIRKTS